MSSFVRKGVLAPPDVLDKYDVESFESVDSSCNTSTSGIKYRGWNFWTTHGKMANEAEGLQLSQTVSRRSGADCRDDDTILLRSNSEQGERENHLHVPPMHFPHDKLVLSFDSSVGTGGNHENDKYVQTHLELNTLDALSCWAIQHRADSHRAFIPEVPYAHKWQPPKLEGGKQDSNSSTPINLEDKQTDISSDAQTLGDISAVQYQEWDWTYSTPYNVTSRFFNVGTPQTELREELLSYMISGGIPLSHGSPSVPMPPNDGESHLCHHWQAVSQSGINFAMLKRQDQPILFFDELLLYQDDLEDCGESTFDVKMRVMPECWFVLARLFTRVDGGRIVMRETRLFHEFGTGFVAMELTWRQNLQSEFCLKQPGDIGSQMSSRVLPGGSRPVPLSSVQNQYYPGSAGRGSPISSSQLRDANIMSSLMTELSPECNYNHALTADDMIKYQHGSFTRPVFKYYVLPLTQN